MPEPMPLRCEDDVVAYVARTCFKTGPPRLVGAEVEWFVLDPRRPQDPPPLDRVRAAVATRGPLPGGSAITYEPGGQLELSSLPAASLTHCWRALAADIATVAEVLDRLGLRLAGYGVDPLRPAARLVGGQRYAAMEEFFAADGDAGQQMMCSTAAVQVCLDAGQPESTPDLANRGLARRWRLAHLLGPVLVAAFANSPICAGRRTGWRSTRQAIWQAMDRSRTAPAAGADPIEAWTAYALAARVMLIRFADRRWLADPGLTFADWLRGQDGLPAPTQDDLDYHLGTLFPPVRPRGHLELRMIDAQAPEHWAVAVAVSTALLDDPAAAARATQAVAPVAGRWRDAARHALTDADLAAAAQDCFAAAYDALPRLGADAELIGAVATYADRYVEAGRCPADDVLAPRRSMAWR